MTRDPLTELYTKGVNNNIYKLEVVQIEMHVKVRKDNVKLDYFTRLPFLEHLYRDPQLYKQIYKPNTFKQSEIKIYIR